MGAVSDFAAQIAESGAITSPAWHTAFAEVPRELFVPYYYVPAPGGYERLWRDDPDPERRSRWLTGVYQDAPLATRLRDGELLSSSSQPSLMARMLEGLGLADGMTVLEIGTGTGYNAALLCHRLGESRVTTVDLDPEITESARRHLESAGYHPRVVTGDGVRGCPDFAPYDRIIITAALPTIPRAWLEQCATNAVILAPFATGLLSLRVADATHATGRFLATPAFFVPLRGGDPAIGTEEAATEGVPEHALSEDSFRFLLTLSAGHLVPRDAYTLWRDQGQPARVRYGITIDGEAVWAWLDNPTGPHSWRLR